MKLIEPEIAQLDLESAIPRFTHSHLVSHLFPLGCNWCDTDSPLPMSHLLTCPHLAKLRNIHKVSNNAALALANDFLPINKMFSFLQATNLLSKIQSSPSSL